MDEVLGGVQQEPEDGLLRRRLEQVEALQADTGIGSWGPRVCPGSEAEARRAVMHREDGMWMIAPDSAHEGRLYH